MMSEKEQKELLEGLKEYKRKVTRSKKASRKFLERLGIVDSDGNKTEAYKDLCIQ